MAASTGRFFLVFQFMVSLFLIFQDESYMEMGADGWPFTSNTV